MCPKSNPFNLLYTNLLPAILMMIQSKLNKLAWIHHFPIISLWDMFQALKGSLLTCKWSALAEIRIHQILMHVLVTCKFIKTRINSNREKVETSTFRPSRTANFVVNGPIWQTFKLTQAFKHIRVTWKYCKDNDIVIVIV